MFDTSTDQTEIMKAFSITNVLEYLHLKRLYTSRFTIRKLLDQSLQRREGEKLFKPPLATFQPTIFIIFPFTKDNQIMSLGEKNGLQISHSLKLVLLVHKCTNGEVNMKGEGEVENWKIKRFAIGNDFFRQNFMLPRMQLQGSVLEGNYEVNCNLFI